MSTSTKSKTDLNHGSFTIEKHYPAAPEKVFAAFGDKQKKRRWFVDGEGFETISFDMDFRVGGREQSQFRVTSPTPVQGKLITNDAVYLDIVSNQRIIAAYTMAFGDKLFSASMITIEFLPGKEATSTTLIFTEQGAYFGSSDGVAGREQGTRELLDALGKELERND